MPPFDERMRRAGLDPLYATGISIFQMNLGKLCNQTCRHCHVDAAPDRREMMTRETAEACLDALAGTRHPDCRYHRRRPGIESEFSMDCDAGPRARTARHRPMQPDRPLLVPSQADLASFLADRQVEIIASLPYYQPRADRRTAGRWGLRKVDRRAPGSQPAWLRSGRKRTDSKSGL
ncbi:MAG: hypothetical protein MPW15_02855 [Candidatus Manganitrophus sp.]|nr:hypothetical protein [Candidatus Manganitrophus sp.]